MSNEDTPPVYGGGQCAVCYHATKVGNLMCSFHWSQVGPSERTAVYSALRRWDQNEGTLLELRQAQAKAVESVTGVRQYPTLSGGDT